MSKFVVIIFSFFVFPILAQEGSDLQLAQYYYANGEFDKAGTYYEKIYEKDPSKINFDRYYDCLIQTQSYKIAEKILKKEGAKRENDVPFQLTIAQFYETIGEVDKTEKIYEKVIDQMLPYATEITKTYDAFVAVDKLELGLKVLEKGRKILKKDYPLNIQFASYYQKKGLKDLALDEYFNLIEDYPMYLNLVQTQMSSFLDLSSSTTSDYELIRVRCLKKVQSQPDKIQYSELIIWLFLNGGNYNGALQQVTAIDKRQQEEGGKVLELANQCSELNQFSVAKKAYQYVIDLGKEKNWYPAAKFGLLNVLYKEVTTFPIPPKEVLTQTIQSFDLVINEQKIGRNTLNLVLQKTYIQAFFAKDITAAVSSLESCLLLPDLTDVQKATVKMQLADILVLNGAIWDASLYYMQIDKDFKFEAIGHEAKFKNARIYYYDGEFEFAQSQLGVLKESTSKLIANDAMELSLLITENYGLDSNYQAMLWFANADLLIEQHKYQEGFNLMDSITTSFPYHSLTDEIYLKKAYALCEQGKWEDAISYLEKIVTYYPQDLLADDAIFKLGEIYEFNLIDKEKAASYYKKILFEYKGSLHVVEARKRYRTLRGDLPEKELN